MRRILLDEGVQRSLARRLRAVGFRAAAFPNDWKQLSNGALLDEVERHGYEILITNDKRMSYQQTLSSRNLAVLVLPSTRRNEVVALIPQIVAALTAIEPKQFLELGTSVSTPSRDG